MRHMYRRQKRQTLFAGIVVFAGVLNLLFYLILYRPAQSDYERLQRSIGGMRADVVTRNQTVARLQRVSEQLELSTEDRRKLFTGRFISRVAGFAEILRELDGLAQGSGVIKRRVDYDIQDIPQFGLASVKIRMPVQGGYSNVVNFISELEQSGIFLIIHSVDVTSGDANIPLALALNMETFFYQ